MRTVFPVSSRGFAFGVSVVVLVLAITFCWQMTTRVSLASAVYDFGAIPQGEQLRHTFWQRNTSFRTLHIADIRSTCGCTIPKLKGKSIGPFGAFEVPVTVNTADKNGEFRSSITVDFENHPRVQLALKGTFIREYPERVDFGDFRWDQPPFRSFHVKSVTKKNLSVSSVDFDKEFLNVHVGQDAEGPVMTIVVRPDVPTGAFEKLVRFTTNDGTNRVRSIRVVGSVLPRIVVHPKIPSFGKVTHVSRATLRLRVEAPYGETVEVISVESNHLEYTVEEADESSAKFVNVIESLPDGFPNGFFAEPISIHARVGGELETLTTTIYGLLE